MVTPDDTVVQDNAQRRYADLLLVQSRIGLAILLIGFVVYIAGFADPVVPIAEVSEQARSRVEQFVTATGWPSGWDWVKHLQRGDVIANLGVMFLSTTTILCLIAVLPVYAGRRDACYTVIVLLQIAILVFAASGVFRVGGH